MSHSRTVPSGLLVASVRSSRLIAAHQMPPACPENTRVIGVQSAVDNTCAPVSFATAISLPSGEKRAVWTPPATVTVRAGVPELQPAQERDRDEAAIGAQLDVSWEIAEGERGSEGAPVGQRPEA